MLRIIVVMSLLMIHNSAYGFIGNLWSYFYQYQLGFEYSISRDVVLLDYEMAKNGPTNSSCVDDINDATRQICSVSVEAGRSSGWGIFVQQPFRRQGNILLNFDIGFGVRYLAGEVEDELPEALPLQMAEFQLLSVLAKPYMQIGYTPLSGFPDVILTLGPVIQSTFGEVTINEQKESVAIASASGVAGYAELEVVFLRFGDGAISLYSATDSSGKDSTPFFPGEVDGMSEFAGTFQRSISGSTFGYGLKIVLNWP